MVKAVPVLRYREADNGTAYNITPFTTLYAVFSPATNIQSLVVSQIPDAAMGGPEQRTMLLGCDVGVEPIHLVHAAAVCFLLRCVLSFSLLAPQNDWVIVA